MFARICAALSGGGGSRKTIKYSRHIAANITELPDVLRGRRRLPNSSNSALRNHEAMSVSPIPSPVWGTDWLLRYQSELMRRSGHVKACD